STLQNPLPLDELLIRAAVALCPLSSPSPFAPPARRRSSARRRRRPAVAPPPAAAAGRPSLLRPTPPPARPCCSARRRRRTRAPSPGPRAAEARRRSLSHLPHHAQVGRHPLPLVPLPPQIVEILPLLFLSLLPHPPSQFASLLAWRRRTPWIFERLDD